jgi:hypothetical protein
MNADDFWALASFMQDAYERRGIGVGDDDLTGDLLLDWSHLHPGGCQSTRKGSTPGWWLSLDQVKPWSGQRAATQEELALTHSKAHLMGKVPP